MCCTLGQKKEDGGLGTGDRGLRTEDCNHKTCKTCKTKKKEAPNRDASPNGLQASL